MDDLGSLLGRFKDSLDKDSSIREAVAVVIKEELGFDVRLEDISLKGSTLYIHTSPAKRSEIKLHEKAILNKSAERTGLDLKQIAY